MHYLCINKIYKELQRALIPIELALGPYFLLQMFILWISMCMQCLMKFRHCLFKLSRIHFLYVLSMHKQNPFRITKGNNSNRISPYFSVINIHLMDINVFANFDKISSLPVQDMEKPKKSWTNVKTAYPQQKVCRGCNKISHDTRKPVFRVFDK